ncbi:FAD-dependent oxidoreductase [Rhodococcoides corynebacterioides]|uniref:ferredoxin--NADP(+) reductase n=1 Tax=Rhodococcoides corynebacterioides TaxID=53972 RepID=A0ABS7NZF4_9NOCA|nr:FAD-dependent oxidoreductase [Rhodococcus corynebacterioides]MBY6365517.1 FAD-dependent oxidoreductase [Rhodococcus corynebacterioides]MBY6408627.1 FAD-dependent oxidoreductase [Rhodococcus corynebacterioides]
MAFAITQNCCNDASCLSVCPVNCIHPTPDEPDFGTTDLLYIDPRSCIDCGACADACPVDAITRVSRLTPEQQVYADLNADYYRDRPVDNAWGAPRFPLPNIADVSLGSVAVIGTGPAACYAATAILRQTDARVTFYERLAVPGGLARFGVAPDHTGTRRIGEHFRPLFDHPRVTVRTGVNVGADVDVDDLRAAHDAVVVAVGADRDRTLPWVRSDSGGVAPFSARTLVGWYTGHPGVPADAVDLTGVRRVVVIGNGNVALDAARILTADPNALAATEIAPHALAALRAAEVAEVVVVARRGPEHAAFTRPECQALVSRAEVPVVIAGPGAAEAAAALPFSASASPLAGVPEVTLSDLSGPAGTGRRIVFAFGVDPAALRRADGALEMTATTADRGSVTLRADLVLQAVGYRGAPLGGLPFDEDRGTVRNVDGRVVRDDGTAVPRTYVVGWAKRGATGGIGDNKADAEATVEAMLADAVHAGTAGAPGSGRSAGRRRLLPLRPVVRRR